ncbi:MAG: beta-lactamase family protein [Anaerolineae bacterium]|nr:beta-lactamase family protein [Anaerolineae bacterium]
MHDTLKTLMQASPVTGLAVATVTDGTIHTTYLGTWDGAPITAETIWPVASLTKPVFSVGVLQLVQQGLLELDRPLQAYLPQPYLNGVDFLDEITARHTLTHTSGLPNWRDSQGLRTGFRPGSRFSYSSEGLNYLQHVVEYLLSKSMAEYLREHLFLPLDMPTTILEAETEESLGPHLGFLAATLPANGALSLRTTLLDYARFVEAMLTSDSFLLGSEMHRAMLMPHISVGVFEQLHWGLGWGLQQVDHEWSFWHWGARGLPRTMNVAVGWPDRHEAILIYTNHADGLYLCREIIQATFPGRALPAFDWLLPARDWRADGSRPSPV